MSTSERGWVVNLLQVLDQALSDDGKLTFNLPSGEEIVTTITADTVDFIKNNQCHLLSVGFETFQLFLIHKSKGEDLDALEELYSKIDTDELVEMSKVTAIQMDQYAKKIQEVRRFWVDLAKRLGTNVALGLLSTVVR